MAARAEQKYQDRHAGFNSNPKARSFATGLKRRILFADFNWGGGFEDAADAYAAQIRPTRTDNFGGPFLM